MCMSGCFCCANVIVVCVCARSTKQHTSNNMLYQHLAKRCEAKNTKGTGTYIIYDYNHIHTHTRAHADCALLPFIIWKNANGTGITASKCVNMWNDFESSTGGYIVINDCHHGHTHIHTWISVLSGVRDVFFSHIRRNSCRDDYEISNVRLVFKCMFEKRSQNYRLCFL